jgi:hypothetical protein
LRRKPEIRVIGVIKLRRRWAEQVTRVSEVSTGFWWGNLTGDHLEDIGVDGRILLKLIFKKYDGEVDWIDLALDRDRRSLVTAVPIKWEYFFD